MYVETYQISSDILTETGYNIQCHAYRSRSSSTHLRQHSSNLNPRWHFPSQLSPLVRQLQSRREKSTILLHPPRNWARLQDLRERLHHLQAPSHPTKLLHLARRRETPDRNRRDDANGRRHRSHRRKGRNQKSLQVRRRANHLHARRSLGATPLRRPRHQNHRLQTTLHASRLGELQTLNIHLPLRRRLRRLHARLLSTAAEAPPRPKGGSGMVRRSQKRSARHRSRTARGRKAERQRRTDSPARHVALPPPLRRRHPTESRDEINPRPGTAHRSHARYRAAAAAAESAIRS